MRKRIIFIFPAPGQSWALQPSGFHCRDRRFGCGPDGGRAQVGVRPSAKYDQFEYAGGLPGSEINSHCLHATVAVMQAIAMSRPRMLRVLRQRASEEIDHKRMGVEYA